MDTLRIQMLGNFSIEYKDQRICDQDNRSRKVWTLMAYLIYHRQRVVPQEELIELLWSEDQQGNNPNGTLKAMIHRARNMLDALWPSAGMDLIVRQGSGYAWNQSIPCQLDIDLFESLCRSNETDDRDLEQQISALSCYHGSFLTNLSSETWVIPVAAYYHNCYVRQLMIVLPELISLGRYHEVAALCYDAVTVEPFHEQIHCYFMRALLAMGDRKGAVRIYQKLRESLFSNFCILPSEETRALYYEATKTINDHAIGVDVLQQQLQEDYQDGALICEYDFFRVLYHSMARSMARSGIATHIAVLTVTGKTGSQLPLKQQETFMCRLEEQIRMSLRRGDAGARCSICQYVIMLPRANYEDSCMVCNRVIRTFFRKYPRADVDIQFTVCPIQPDMKEFSRG